MKAQQAPLVLGQDLAESPNQVALMIPQLIKDPATWYITHSRTKVTIVLNQLEKKFSLIQANSPDDRWGDGCCSMKGLKFVLLNTSPLWNSC